MSVAALEGHTPSFLGGGEDGIASLVFGDLVGEVCLTRTGHSPSVVWQTLTPSYEWKSC